MNIQLMSDLHLEVHPHFRPEPAPGADLLVLAGDIGAYQTRNQVQDADFGLSLFADWPVPVVYVPGNHEYDALDFDEAHQRLRASCAKFGFHWLEREVLVLQGVRFVGTTLWSDFDALLEFPERSPAVAARNQKAREKAFRAANHYLRTTGGTHLGQPMLAEAIRAQAHACQAWLRGALAQPYSDGPTVVVTHFAPSLRSGDPRYGLTPGTAGFCNALDDLLPRADLWLHGHLHCPSDYTDTSVRQGVEHRCRVVANPLGYVRNGEQEGFRPQLCVGLDTARTP